MELAIAVKGVHVRVIDISSIVWRLTFFFVLSHDVVVTVFIFPVRKAIFNEILPSCIVEIL